MNAHAAAHAYTRIGAESRVLSASPHELICLLFDAAGVAIRTATLHLRAGRIARKGEAIGRALDIVNDGLCAAVDREHGGELAARLVALYEYVARRLLDANLHNDAAALAEAERLLESIGSAWRAIDPAAPAHALTQEASR